MANFTYISPYFIVTNLQSALATICIAFIIGCATQDAPTKLEKRRAEAFSNQYLRRPWDGSLAKQVLSGVDSSINLNRMYYCLVDNTKTKFVAFFAQTLTRKEFWAMRATENPFKPGGSVTVRMESNVDARVLDLPGTYAYIVKGLEYQNKWYYLKDEATFLDSITPSGTEHLFINRLQEWNFFKEKDTKFNPDFWETALFGKVEDLRKHPDWLEKKHMWEAEEKRYRKYIGLYKIVADATMARHEEDLTRFEQQINQKFLVPLMESRYNDQLKPKITYIKGPRPILIFPGGRNVVIAPMTSKEKNGKFLLHYFVILPGSNEVYEWSYFPKAPKENTNFQEHDELNTITKWGNEETLDDRVFWEKYVLLKDNGQYKYLKLVK